MGPLYAAIDMHRLAIGHGRPNPRPSGTLDAVDIVRRLLEQQGRPERAAEGAPSSSGSTRWATARSANGATPFMRAAKSGDVEVMKLLLDGGRRSGADAAERPNALMFAAGLGWRDGSPAAPSYDQGTPEDAVAGDRAAARSRAST